ncbi:hypothetical protein X773_23135 [Mesorhizobium sp. LSJC285A00]|nr:hypothetical protein X773_23135 [Mesorhizobium sp. LSJC285A00]
MAAKQSAHHLQVTSATQLCQKLARIDTESLGDVEKLNDVQPTFTTLVLGHEGLWAAQHISNLGLGGPFGFARRNQPA